MKIHHFVYPYVVTDASVVISDAAIVHQIERVLKLEVGEHIALIHPNGGKVVCEIVGLDRERVICTILHSESAPSGSGVHLYLSVLKKEHFEVACQGAVQVGVSAVTGIIADRTIKTGINEPRLAKLIQEAAEQSQQLYVPAFTGIVPFADAVERARSAGKSILFFDPTGVDISTVSGVAGDVAVFIGPEGGWSEAELLLVRTLQEHSPLVHIVSCGDSILRAETAAVVGVYTAKQLASRV